MWSGLTMTTPVLLTTSGLGSRLGELTEHMNKALIRVGTKPVISHIIDAYPEGTEFVITLGYKGQQIREFIEVAYPDLRVTFVEVDQWEGEHSSLGRSMLAAKEHLQRPFIFHASDSIAPIDPGIVDLEANWVLTANCPDASAYRTLKQSADALILIQEKGQLGHMLAHIGIARIEAWDRFWFHMERFVGVPGYEPGLSDAHGINAMIYEDRVPVSVVYTTGWHDTGNAKSLDSTRKALSVDGFVNLEKTDQAVYILGDRVIKFFASDAAKRAVVNRVARAENLRGAVPEILAFNDHFFSYRKADGPLARDAMYPAEFAQFMRWCQTELWEEQSPMHPSVLKKFYYQKTMGRLEAFGIEDQVDVINGVAVPTLAEMLQKVDWGLLEQGVGVKRFHGDLHLSNVIITNEGYKLLDWRDTFGDLIEQGDVYYDLAKILHGLIVSHDLVDQEMFKVEWSQMEPGVRRVSLDIMRHQRLVECEKFFALWCYLNSYRLDRVKTLTALIYLNIAVLHHYPYNHFLYFLGKQMLFETLS
jgi:GTP:adenosylcobinamide-phosphate guanylyltransferase